MVKGEAIMAVPEGMITTSQIWSEDGNNNQAVEEATQESVSEEANATESEVVEGGSETEDDSE
jgi:hypothetical protein